MSRKPKVIFVMDVGDAVPEDLCDQLKHFLPFEEDSDIYYCDDNMDIDKVSDVASTLMKYLHDGIHLYFVSGYPYALISKLAFTLGLLYGNDPDKLGSINAPYGGSWQRLDYPVIA